MGESTGLKHSAMASSPAFSSSWCWEPTVPPGVTLDTSLPLAPVQLSYILSFIFARIYWVKLPYASYLSSGDLSLPMRRINA